MGQGHAQCNRVHTTAKFSIIPDRDANKQQLSFLFHFLTTNKNLSLLYIFFSYLIKYFKNIITLKIKPMIKNNNLYKYKSGF